MSKFFLSLTILLAVLANSLVYGQVGIITTVVGNGSPGYPTDGMPATSVAFPIPRDVAMDKYKNLYVAANYAVIKVDTFGILTTVAGYIGTLGFSGDGGPATSAQLAAAMGVAVDPSGNIYISDASNNRIRKVNTAGIINTIAGNDTASFGGDGGPATLAKLNGPWDVDLDRWGNIYIADYGNHRIRKISTAGIITTVAGTGTWGYSGDGGLATSAQLTNPTGIVVDDTGNIYIADNGNCRLRKVNTAGIITTIAGTSICAVSSDGIPATTATLSMPLDVAIDKFGNIYFSDQSAQKIRKIDPSGIITTVAGTGFSAWTSCGSCYSGDGGPATNAKIRLPMGLIVDSLGNNLYYADGQLRVRKVKFDFGIGASPGDSVCSGTPVTYYANSIVGCSSPTYQWFKNGTAISGVTSNTYSYTPVNGDSIRCVMSCSGGATYNSNTIRMVVRPVVVPTNTITSFSGSTVCAGTLVTFVSTTTFGGPSPTYKWYVNGVMVSSGSSASYAYVPFNGDNVYCQLISSIPCATPATLSSNHIIMTVNPFVTPMITITCSPNDTVCAGIPVTFTAASTGGGSIPTYQWKVNGVNVGTGLFTYTYTPAAGDSIKCVLTSSSTCALSTTATSNVIGIYIIPVTPPAVTVTPFPNDTVCTGVPVTFVAVATGGGTAPTYQWRKNGAVVGSGSTYTYTPSTGDSVRCNMTTNATCVTGTTVTSSMTYMTVEPYAAPSVAISVTPNDTVCEGQLCTYNASAILGGSAPFFQWKKNGLNVGTGGTVYSYSPVAGDSISCMLTSSNLCATPSTVGSNVIAMQVDTTVTPFALISGPTSAMFGNTVTLTATVSGAGSSYTIIWMDYGVVFDITTVPTVTFIKSSGLDVITAKVVSNSVGCYDTGMSNVFLLNAEAASAPSVTMSEDDIQVYPNPANATITVSVGKQKYSSLTVTDVVGRKLFQTEIKGIETQIDVADFPAGLYYISLQGEESSRVLKFVKE